MMVSIPQNTCKKAAKLAMRGIRKEIALPGFRKGHVPEDLITKHFGKDLSRQMEKELAIIAFNEGTKLLQKHPFSQMGIRTLAVRKYAKETGAEVHLEYETDPEVPKIAVESLKLDAVHPKPVAEKDILDFITRMKFLFSEKKPVTDRPVQIGDEVQFDIVRPNDNKRMVDKLFCYEGLMPAWLLKGIVGMNLNEEKEIEVDNEGHSEELKKCPVKVLEINECCIPSDTDKSFLERVGVSSTDDLRKVVSAKLEFEAQTEAQSKMRRQLRNELIRLYAFDLPQTLVEQETEARFKDYQKAHESETIDKESTRKSILDEVKRQLTCTLLLEPLFNMVRALSESQDVQRELWHQLREVPQTQCNLHSSLKQEQMIERLWSNVLAKHAEDWLIEQNLGIKPPQRHLASVAQAEEVKNIQQEELPQQLEAST